MLDHRFLPIFDMMRKMTRLSILWWTIADIRYECFVLLYHNRTFHNNAQMIWQSELNCNDADRIQRITCTKVVNDVSLLCRFIRSVREGAGRRDREYDVSTKRRYYRVRATRVAISGIPSDSQSPRYGATAPS